MLDCGQRVCCVSFKSLQDIRTCPCLPQFAPQHIIAQNTRNEFQRLQVMCRLIVWRKHQKKEVCRFVVDALEIDAAITDADSHGRL